MSFLSRIKASLSDPLCHARGKVFISHRDLEELVYHFERIDSLQRLENGYKEEQDLCRQLYLIIDALYHSEKRDSGAVALLAMEAVLKNKKANQRHPLKHQNIWKK